MRTAQAEPKTRERLLDVAQRLILAKGFAATSIDRICEVAKLTKGCFFHYFDSKEELGRALLERYCAEGQKKRLECCARQPADPLQRVEGQIDFAVKMAKECSGQGCLLGQLAQELSDSYPEIRSLCAEGFNTWAESLRKDLEQAKAKYAPDAAFDPKSLAEHFIAVLEGAQILAKTKRDSRVVEKSLEHFREYVRSLFREGGKRK